MLLKELELVGFKSFPERTRLKFEQGVTAIVGPNGCGKSNVFDGIRWVLGEQSTKALRSLKMEDVIFNGSDGKSSLGMAEVTLFFSNKSRKLGLDSDEIEISRRIFRSGESQYLLNKAPVRLKDISDLFMGTGIGAESYSLVEQGKIDLILSSRPEERRLIFYEASGITKYKAQKKEALRKLEETEQNILRINDIITEVRREINSLERQANKARRYKDVFQELKNKEINLGTLETLEIEKQKQDLLNKINTAGDNLNVDGKKSQDLQSQMQLRVNRIQQLDKEISSHHDQLINFDNLIDNNKQRIQINKERVDELNAHILDLEDQLKDAKERSQAAEKNLENFQKQYNEIKDRIQEKGILLSRKQKEYEEANLSIKSSKEKTKQSRGKILDLAAASSRIRNEIADLQAYLKSQILRKKRLDIEREKTKEERKNLSQLLNQQASELDNIKSQLNHINDEQNQTREKVSFQLKTQERLTQNIQGLENERIALQSQREFLEELRLKYEGINQSLNAVLYLDRLPGDNISGIMIKVNGDPLPREKWIKDIPKNLKFKLQGQAKPIPLETKTITQRIDEIQSDINQKQENQIIIQKTIQKLNQDLQDLGEKAKDKEILISNKGLQFDNLTEQLNKINQEYEVLGLELEDLEGQIEQFNKKQAQLEANLYEVGEQQKKEDETIDSLESSVVHLSSLREQILIDVTQIKTEVENQKAHLAQHEKTQTLLSSAFQESQQLHQRYLDEIQRSRLKIEQLSEETEKLSQQLLKADEDRVKSSKEQAKYRGEFQELSKFQEQDNHQVLLFSKNIEGLRKEIYDYQLQVKELDFKQRSIHDRISQVYKVVLSGDSSDLEISQDKEILTGEISELRQKLESLGTVNLIAIEEYEELKKRYDFLTQQHNDLTRAKQYLNDAINKINRTTRQMFLDAFKKIQVEFSNYFRLLFGQGQAQIMLTDETDPLESGIEIVCRPPGKKLQNVLALSGGEKALSAVALMFAIFKVKPAPFCVLDEVDAALDESNIERFGGILQEFAKLSQFLVITHNKRTIANADVMYGITMQEPGISKIVSVKLS